MAAMLDTLQTPFPILKSKHAAWAVSIDNARAVINSVFALGVMDTYSARKVSLTVLKDVATSAATSEAAREQRIRGCVNMLYNLFGCSVLHTKSVFAQELQAGLSKFPGCLAFMKLCDKDKRANLLQYKQRWQQRGQ